MFHLITMITKYDADSFALICVSKPLLDNRSDNFVQDTLETRDYCWAVGWSENELQALLKDRSISNSASNNSCFTCTAEIQLLSMNNMSWQFATGWTMSLLTAGNRLLRITDRKFPFWKGSSVKALINEPWYGIYNTRRGGGNLHIMGLWESVMMGITSI